MSAFAGDHDTSVQMIDTSIGRGHYHGDLRQSENEALEPEHLGVLGPASRSQMPRRMSLGANEKVHRCFDKFPTLHLCVSPLVLDIRGRRISF